MNWIEELTQQRLLEEEDDGYIYAVRPGDDCMVSGQWEEEGLKEHFATYKEKEGKWGEQWWDKVHILQPKWVNKWTQGDQGFLFVRENEPCKVIDGNSKGELCTLLGFMDEYDRGPDDYAVVRIKESNTIRRVFLSNIISVDQTEH